MPGRKPFGLARNSAIFSGVQVKPSSAACSSPASRRSLRAWPADRPIIPFSKGPVLRLGIRTGRRDRPGHLRKTFSPAPGSPTEGSRARAAQQRQEFHRTGRKRVSRFTKSRSHSSSPLRGVQPLCMPAHVVLAEARHEIIAVIVTRLQPDDAGLAAAPPRKPGHRLGLQLVQKLIRRALTIRISPCQRVRREAGRLISCPSRPRRRPDTRRNCLRPQSDRVGLTIGAKGRNGAEQFGLRKRSYSAPCRPSMPGDPVDPLQRQLILQKSGAIR